MLRLRGDRAIALASDVQLRDGTVSVTGDGRQTLGPRRRILTQFHLHYNSAHAVRNAATAYSAAFATDSWPHMLRECEAELSALSLQGCATDRPTPGEAGNCDHEK